MWMASSRKGALKATRYQEINNDERSSRSVNYYIPSMLFSVLGSSEILNSALSLKSEYYHVSNVMAMVNSERIKFEMQKEK